MEFSNNIKSKVYYDLTGKVIIITAEQERGAITTKAEDMANQEALKSMNINDVFFIELEYGTLLNTVQHSKSYHVNLETKQLKVEYYTQAEIDELNNNISLSESEQLEIDNANLLLELVQKDILISQLQGGV